MDVEVKKLENSQVELMLTLPWTMWSKSIDHAAESLSKNVKTAGFRPGKTPRAVLEKRFGKSTLLAEAAEHAVNHAYSKAVTEKKIEAIGHPKVTLGTVAEGEPLIITLVTDVLPKVEAGNWRDIAKRINKEFSQKISTITPIAVTAEIERIAKMRAPLITVDRGAMDGDTVLLDFKVTQDGVGIENGTSKNHPLVIGSNSFIPGFEEEVRGMKAGEEKTFTLTFPSEYHAAHLAGKKADFAVTIRAVQEMQVPELNDEFAQSLGAFDTLAALEKSVADGMEAESGEQRKNENRTAILDALVEAQTIEYPESLVAQEIGRIKTEFSSQLTRMGATYESFLDQSKKSEDEITAEWLPQAKKRVAAYLLLDVIARDENVFTQSEEIEVEMNKALAYFKGAKDAEKNLDMPALYNMVTEQVRNEKVFHLLETTV